MLDNVSVLAELERSGIEFRYASAAEISLRCPFHKDSSPSCFVNIEKRVFVCQASSCKATGDFASLLAAVYGTDRATVLADLATRYDVSEERSVSMEVIERWHDAIWTAGPLLDALKTRGISNELIRRRRLGCHEGRIMIPIPNESGSIVNVRKYLPGAAGADKMRNMRGRGKLRLYPIDQLKYDTIMICSGEIKAILAASELNQHGIGAICCTGGEGNWSNEFTKLFKNKTVYVCYDIDAAGRKGASVLLTLMFRTASWAGDLRLPLDPEVFPHGDINDYCGPAVGLPLYPLLDAVPRWTPQDRSVAEDDLPVQTTFLEASHARMTAKRVMLEAVVSAVEEAPFSIPQSVRVSCDRSQPDCSKCSYFFETDDETTLSIHPEHPCVLEMVASPSAVQRDAIMEGVGIPDTCKSCSFDVDQFMNVEHARVSPPLDLHANRVDRDLQPAFLVGDGVELNESYSMVGRMHPAPKNQQATLLISAYKPATDALSSYVPSDLNRLQIFQPEEWTVDGIEQKLFALYGDLSANVTRIYQRQDLHLMIDLTYHSVLWVPFDRQTVKGWTEILILGDSAQGKTDSVSGLMRHYGLGTKLDCKNATVAGLLGGLQKMGTRWFVTWGAIPTHDRRLVHLEEVKGAPPNVIAALTDARSSGIAELHKIQRRRTHARTRLLATSNPRSDMPLSSYNYGVLAVKELLGSLEDVRRFDAVLLLSGDDVDSEQLNVLSQDRPSVPHLHTSVLCQNLILWAWTLKADKIRFEDEATSEILKQASEMSMEFSDAIPIVDRGSMRHKLSRLSTALACRTFSSSGVGLLVRRCHVEYIATFLRRHYSSKASGYGDFSRAMAMTNRLIQPELISRAIQGTSWPKDFVEQMLHKDEIDLIDIQDWCSINRVDAQDLLSVFVRKHGLVRSGRSYRKTPPFIDLLKELLTSLPDRPEFLEEGEF